MAAKGILATDSYPLRTPTMGLNEIVTEICKRVNDPFEDNYADRARELFIASVHQGIKDPKWTKFDYYGLVGTKDYSTGGDDPRILKVLGIENDITGDSPAFKRRYLIDITDIVSQQLSEANPSTRKYVPIDLSEANRIATDADLEPIRGEVYWYIAGDKLYLHPSPQENMKGQNFIIEYLAGTKDFHITEDMLTYFSVAYIYDAMDIATGKLLSEIGLV